MKKNGRVLLCFLCAMVFLMLASTLVDKPENAVIPTDKRPSAAAFISPVGYAERSGSDQTAPLRIDRPEGSVITLQAEPALPAVRADANGHPLCESTYIHAVYQAFRLEDKSG